MSADILVVKPGTLNDSDKETLRKSGVVVVDADNPDDVRFLRAQEAIGGHELALAAMKALDRHGYGEAKTLFVKLVTEAMERKSSAELAKGDA